jgi:hypothetical protein
LNKKQKFLPFNLPENAEKEISALWKSKPLYHSEELKTRVLSNVFVTEDGLVLKRGVLMKGSAMNISGFKDKTFGKFFYKKALQRWVLATLKKIPSIRSEKNKAIVLVHTPWFNYAFWITDGLGRILQAKEEGLFNEAKLWVPEEIYSHVFVRECLEYLNVPVWKTPAGYHVFIDKLWLPPSRSWSAGFNPQRLFKTRSWLWETLINDRDTSKNKVFILRGNRVRRIVNEDKVIDILETHGFSFCNFESLTFKEQIQCMHKTSVLVGVHGAGLANMIALEPGSLVVECVGRDFAFKESPMPYARLAASLGLRYRLILCDIEATATKLLSGYGKQKGNDDLFLVNQALYIPEKMLINTISEF